MPNLDFSFSTSPLIVAFFVLVATAISVYFYRQTLPPVPTSRKVFLIVLRSLALSLLLMFLFEPLLRLISTSTEKPVLAVLIDNSKSMQIKDKTGDRATRVRELLQSTSVKNVEGLGVLRFFTFGTKTNELVAIDADSLALNDDATDMTAALRTIRERRDVSNIGAILLATDGNYNLGQNPIYEAEQLGLPIFAVGIGDSTEQKDLLITKVSANELVYAETEVPVDVTVKSAGYKGEKVEVILSDGGKELKRAQLTLEEGTREYSVRLSYVPEGDQPSIGLAGGMKKYTLRISRLPNELTTANNQKSFFARILKNKLRLLIIAGPPSPDLAIIKQTLREDRNIEVRSVTQKTSSSFYEGQFTTRLLDSADCILLVGFPTATTDDNVLDLLKASITKKTTPVFFVNGKFVDERKLSALSAFLPFTSSNPSTTEQFVFLEPTATMHSVLATDTEQGIESWKRLPPIFRLVTRYAAKAEATVIASTKINNIVLNEPLVLLRSVNRQKSLAILGYGIWRWRLMAQGNSQTEKLLSTFLSNSVRWLTTRDDNRPVKVVPTKDAYTQGELVEFAAQVYDASANPIENAQVKITAKSKQGEFETLLRPTGNGRYEGSLDGLGEGDYTFHANASVDGQSLGDDRGRFTIGELNLEFQDTRMNVQLLRQLSTLSKGKYFSPTEADGLVDALAAIPAFTSRQIQRAESFELWNWKYMLAIVVLLLAVEWFVRKRSGML